MCISVNSNYNNFIRVRRLCRGVLCVCMYVTIGCKCFACVVHVEVISKVGVWCMRVIRFMDMSA